jgi:hypothetical protein
MYLSINQSIYLLICSSTVLLLDLGLFFSFLILYTVGRTPWTGDQPVAKPLPTPGTAKTRNTHRHPCLEWDSNPRSRGHCDRPLLSISKQKYTVSNLN